ncbi:aminotransferase class III-fold pyridoxal phosphate-dependent enzyme [Xanthomonas translucens]|uniref:aminotransferase class III-fold pyridoxal phosphate-dependent enzyme n=1 Tax=Xanthomonas campestris pv. translucens TaxID=343 RepID=UPI001E534028|nr:aminotransferase class III-fold pyridoxal phosphate-dependent enzyme [Xanthomonas translucens]WLA10691.1 aminotransferase class III-fold pyridoxal phosphate-dependent enzyme [Xanthomonas translucens]
MNDPRQLFQHHESNVRSYCRAFDVLFVRGAGSELFDAQSLSGLGLPFSLLLVAPEHDSWLPGEHTGTFRGNNHAMLTATVALRKFWTDDALCTQIDRRGQIVAQALTRMAEHVPEARLKGRGMFMGLDLRTRERAASASAHAFRNGLLIETAGSRGEVLKVMAPLTTPDALLHEGLEILSHAVLSARG